jgi:hypothetical protein
MRNKRLAAVLLGVLLATGVAAAPASASAGTCRIKTVGTWSVGNQIQSVALNWSGCKDYRARAYVSVNGTKSYTAYGVIGVADGSYFMSRSPLFSKSYTRVGVYTDAKKNGVSVGSFLLY